MKAHLDDLEKMVQDDDGKPIDIDAMDDAAIQAKVKEIEEAMHGVQTLQAAAAEMAQQEGSEDGESVGTMLSMLTSSCGRRGPVRG